MELIILDKYSFSVKDHAYVESEYDIITDLIITQKSNFKINKKDINALTGDYVYIKDRDIYLGVIDSVEKKDDNVVITSLDFKEILKIEYVANNYTGKIGNYIENLIRAALINNDDAKVNMNYLSISVETSKMGELTFDQDKIMTIYELLDLVFSMYGIVLKYRVIFDVGKFKGLELRIIGTSEGERLKADNLNLVNLVINESDKKGVNKVVFMPKSDNLYFKDILNYFLLDDGSITDDANSPKRYNDVITKLETYSDNDYLDLPLKARKILSSSKTDHQITFTINKRTTKLDILKYLETGKLLEFIYKGRIYNTICSAIKYSSSLDTCEVTLGEYRLNLTDKLQIMNKGLTSNVSNVSVVNNGFSDMDGGEF